MIFIADRNIKSSLKHMGFNSYDPQINQTLNKSLQAFVQNQAKQLKKHMQKGGAETTLPLEYFGVRTNNYFDDAPKGVDMTVTDSMIRPPFRVVDLQNTIKDGGASSRRQFSIPAVSIKRASANLDVSQSLQQTMKIKFENVMQEVLRKASKKSAIAHLSLSDLESVLNQQQYQKLFKQ